MNNSRLLYTDPDMSYSYSDAVRVGIRCIAWEYLRRNENYQRDYMTHVALTKISNFSENISISGTASDDEAEYILELAKSANISLDATQIENPPPSKWGLAFYCDPNCAGADAGYLWIDPSASMEGGIRPIPPRSNVSRRETNFNNGEFVICSSGSDVYTKIKRHGGEFTIRSSTILHTNANETVSLNKTPSRHLSTYARHVFNEGFHHGYTTRTMKQHHRLFVHRNRLVAFDAHNLNYTDRRTASIVFMRDISAHEWRSDDNLRQTVRRLRKEALRYIDGGYIKLLRSRSP